MKRIRSFLNKKKLAYFHSAVWLCFLILAGSLSGCATWKMGTLGYMEPSKTEFDPEHKTLVGEKCGTMMGPPFIELAARNARKNTIKNAVIMIEPKGMGSCFRIYADK